MLEAANITSPNSRQRLDDGERRLRRIARAGKHWKNTIGRPVDMEGKLLYDFLLFHLLSVFFYHLFSGRELTLFDCSICLPPGLGVGPPMVR